MAFDDKGWPVFPTRSGGAVGTALENKMLHVVGGAEGIRTRIQTLPDGSTVMLKTRDGMPRFTRDGHGGGSTEIYYLEMDSGIVDLINIHPGHPNFSLPGIIYQTDYVAEHVDAATGSEARAVGCGKIRTSDATGPIVPNGAESVSIKSGGTKAIADSTPSSMFTGKTRLYVQALYGSTWSALMLMPGFEGRPTLVISASEDENFTLMTSTGVYTSATKEHYMIWPNSASATICKMKTTAAAEKFRKFILPLSPLAEADKERIEAYILSQSIPDEATTQTVSYETTPTEALGYGFHFNYDGTACDIVDIKEVYIESQVEWGFRSTHYRLKFSEANGVFSVSREVVYGPNDWSVNMNTNVIACPTWTGYLQKQGQKLAGSRSADQIGRVYAYYMKNTLKTIDVTITKEVDAGDERTCDPPYFGGTSPISAGTRVLVEEVSASTELRTGQTSSSVVFSCGGTMIGGDDYAAGVNKLDMQWHHRDVSEVPYNTTVLKNQIPGVTLPYGKPILDLTYSDGAVTACSFSYEQGEHPPGGVDATLAHISSKAWANRWVRVTDSHTEVTSWRTAVIIPYYDAEAAYLYAQRNDTKSGTRGTFATSTGTGGGHYDPLVRFGLDYSITYVTNVSGSPQIIQGPFGYRAYQVFTNPSVWATITMDGVTNGTTPINESTYTDNATLVCSNGAFDCTLPSIERFFAPATIAVEQTYATRTSLNGVTQSPYTAVASGSPIFPTNFALVGWA